MNYFNQRKQNTQYRLMYDYGDGPVVIYEAYDEQDAIREKKRFIERDDIYPVIFRTSGRPQANYSAIDSTEGGYQ